MPLTIATRADDADKHELDITALVFHNNKLYSAADDGKIKVWDDDLKLLGQVQAHPCSVFSLAVGNDTLYSCSNDGTVKAWALGDLKEKGTLLQESNEMYQVCFEAGKLYVGDDAGTVKIFASDKMVGVLEIMHPIVGLTVQGNVVYTSRDLYVIISEAFPSEKRLVTLKAIEGRAPVCIAGDKLCFPSRSGKDIFIHTNSKDEEFPPLGQVQGAHEMIINALCGIANTAGKYLISGGWDKVVKMWKIGEDSSVKMIEDCRMEIVITVLTAGPKGDIYVGGGDGHILRIDVQP